MADNPDVDLDEQALDDIVDQVGGACWACWAHGRRGRWGAARAGS